MICLLARVMSFDLMALLLDPSLFRVIFYDLILCTVLLLWYSQGLKEQNHVFADLKYF